MASKVRNRVRNVRPKPAAFTNLATPPLVEMERLELLGLFVCLQGRRSPI